MWKPYKERNSTKKELRHRFSKDDRNVFKQIILSSDYNVRKVAFNELMSIYSEKETYVSQENTTSSKISGLAEKSSEEIIFSYCEFYLNYAKEVGYTQAKNEFLYKMKRFFKIRGLLYDFQESREENKIEIYPIASNKMRKRHEKAKTLLLKKGWEKEATLISTSVSEFKKGGGSYSSSLKSLYSALEVALKHTLLIINKTSGEKFKEKTISKVLSELKKEKFFSGAEGDFIEDLIKSINKLSAFVAKKRKKGKHSEELHKHELLFCLYGVDNIICYLIEQLKFKK